MKKILQQKSSFISVLLMGLMFSPMITSGQTNTYHAFPDSATRWNFHYQSNCVQGNISDKYTIEMTQDTIINSRRYHKLEVFDVDSFNVGFCGSSHKAGYWGAIREDSTLRKVFIVPVDSSNESLLYDFNLAVGDTIRGYLSSQISLSDSNAVIQAIDSVLVDSIYHKRWKMGVWDNYLIEGIGSTYGLIEPLMPNYLDMPSNELMCVSILNNCVYPDSVKTCRVITGIQKSKFRKNELLLYPNPFQNKISFKSDKVIHELQLYNISGQRIQNIIVNAKSYSWTPKIKAGIYFVKITDQLGNSSMKKLIKTK